MAKLGGVEWTRLLNIQNTLLFLLFVCIFGNVSCAITGMSAIPVYPYGEMISHYNVYFTSGSAYTVSGASVLKIQIDYPSAYWVSSDVGQCTTGGGVVVPLDSKSGDTVTFAIKNVNIPSGTSFNCDMNKIQNPNVKKVTMTPFNIRVSIDSTPLESSGNFDGPYWTRKIPDLYNLVITPLVPRADQVRTPVTFNFTCEGSDVPAGGHITIDLGAGYSDNGVTVYDVTGFTASAVTTSAGPYVTFGVNSILHVGSNISFTLSLIRNPQWGGTKEMSVTTFDNTNAPAATRYTSPYYEDNVGILNVTVSSNDTIRGSTGQYVFSLSSPHYIMSGSKIVIFAYGLSVGFTTDGSTSVVVTDSSNTDYGAATISATFADNTSKITITRDSAADIIPPGNITVVVTNLMAADTLGNVTFYVESWDSYSTLIDQSLVMNNTLTLIPDVLPDNSVSVVLSNSLFGQTGNWTIQVKMNRAVPADGYFIFTIPNYFTVATDSVLELGGSHGTLTFTVTQNDDNTQTLTIDPSLAVSADTVLTFMINKVTNPNIAESVPLLVAAVDGDDLIISQTNGLAMLLLEFPNPIITHVEPSTGVNGLITIFGNYFNAYSWATSPSPSRAQSVTVGSFPCKHVVVISEKELTCTVYGNGANQPIVITSKGKSSSISATAAVVDFADVHTQGLSCVPPFGAADVFNDDMCNCFSGYASESSLGTDCNIRAQCPGMLTQASQANTAATRPQTKFNNDVFTVVQTAPIIKGSRDVIISFVAPSLAVSAQTCNYPGSIWQKSVSSLDCLDVFTFTMPWSQHGLCGFEEEVPPSDPLYLTFKSNMETTVRQQYTSHNGKAYYRLVTSSYLLSVKFRRQIQVVLQSTSLVTVVQPDSEIDLDVISDAIYDVASKYTFVTFDTVANSPYVVDTLTAYWVPSADNIVPANANVTLTATAMSPQPDDLECEVDRNEPCSQRWILQIQTDSNGVQVCNLKGAIVFVPTLLCRDDGVTFDTCLPQTPLPSNISIAFAEKTDLCDDSADVVGGDDGLTLVVSSFADEDLTQPQSVFQPADIAHFQVSVEDPSGTIDSVTFHEITISSEAGSNILYNIDDPVVPPAAAEFNITSEIKRPLPPGVVGIISFKFSLSRQLDSLNTLASSTQDTLTLSTSIVADITFHGNSKKRSVVVGNNNIQKGVIANIVINGAFDGEDVNAAHDDVMEDQFSLFMSHSSTVSFNVLSLFMCVLFVVGMLSSM